MKLHIKRVDVERMLILCSAALVVALALRGQQEAGVRYEEPVSQVTVASDTTDKVNQTSVVVFYQDGEGYLVPVTTTVNTTSGVAKAALEAQFADPDFYAAVDRVKSEEIHCLAAALGEQIDAAEMRWLAAHETIFWML